MSKSQPACVGLSDLEKRPGRWRKTFDFWEELPTNGLKPSILMRMQRGYNGGYKGNIMGYTISLVIWLCLKMEDSTPHSSGDWRICQWSIGQPPVNGWTPRFGYTCFMIVYGPSSDSKVTYLYLRKLWHETKKMVISYCILPALTNYDG